jgi:hypothetical protein
MFQFPTFAFLTEYLINQVGCPIRTSTDQFVLADPRGFSQLITSFFASESLGIPRAPLITYFYSIPYHYGILLQSLLQYVNELVSPLQGKM